MHALTVQLPSMHSQGVTGAPMQSTYTGDGVKKNIGGSPLIPLIPLISGGSGGGKSVDGGGWRSMGSLFALAVSTQLHTSVEEGHSTCVH